MRHKQRPTKSSRHKSVTLVIDSHTSFGDHQHGQDRHQTNHKPHQNSSSASCNQAVQHTPHRHTDSNRLSSSTSLIITGNDRRSPIRSSKFEHNYRHMSDVMRLAFLENNDISLEDCSNIDFNSLSTASILQRNIQQQIQQFNETMQRVEFSDNLSTDINRSAGDDGFHYDEHSCAKTFPTLKKLRHQQQFNETMQRDDFSSNLNADVVRTSGDGFHCDEPGCGKTFPSLRKLRHHKVVHSDEFPFVCEFKGCGKKFKRKFGIDLHSTTHFDLDSEMYSKTSNNSSLPFFGRRMQYSMCKPCGQKFKTVHEYQYHMLKHGKEPFKCPVKGCGQTFSIWKSFQKHRASHYFNYFCKMDSGCDHKTSNLQLLKLHIYCCHFRRKLPENATQAARDLAEAEDDGPQDDEQLDMEDSSLDHWQDPEDPLQVDDSLDVSSSMAENSQKSPVTTPRRDSRLRKNPPRSSAFGKQDYASIKSGNSFGKSLISPPQANIYIALK